MWYFQNLNVKVVDNSAVTWGDQHVLQFYVKIFIQEQSNSGSLCKCLNDVETSSWILECAEETEINGRRDPLRWPRDTIYPQKLALSSSPTCGGRSVGIVRLRTKGHRI
jgi:hypothetical protein